MRLPSLAIAGLILASAMPATAQNSKLATAEKLRRLDIMLMVTGLRCRATEANFTAEYGQFTTAHMASLNHASADMQKSLAVQYGPFGAARALDKLSVTMANTYGQGHPWLSCAQLKRATSVLAGIADDAALEMSADQLLASTQPEGFLVPGE